MTINNVDDLADVPNARFHHETATSKLKVKVKNTFQKRHKTKIQRRCEAMWNVKKSRDVIYGRPHTTINSTVNYST